MSLLFSNEIKDRLVYEIENTQTQLHIVSAYCKKSGLEFIQKNTKNELVCKKLLVRFKLGDIVSGASDLSIYEFCKANGWDMYIRLDLHAKTYIFDRLRCIVGSANLTANGVGLHATSNYEIAQLATVSDEEMRKIDTLFGGAILMTDELYDMMQDYLNNHNMGEITTVDDWSQDILSKFKQNIEVLFTYEFPNCNSLSSLKEDSLDFLGLSSGWDIKTIKKAFMRSNVFLWLVNKLEKAPNKEIYFGTLSADLHNVIINDPKPYRKEVKELQANLLNWIVELEIQNIEIDRPSYSQRIRLV